MVIFMSLLSLLSLLIKGYMLRIAELTEARVASTWGVKVSLRSSVMPRYLISNCHSMSVLRSFKGPFGICYVFLSEKIAIAVLSRLIFIFQNDKYLDLDIYLLIISIDFDKLLVILLISLSEVKITVSSA